MARSVERDTAHGTILNASWSTWNETVVPLIAVARDRLAAQRARHALG